MLDEGGFGFTNAPRLVWRGYQRWRMSDFKEFPTRQQIEDTEPDWEHDIYTAADVVTWIADTTIEQQERGL